MGNSKIRIIHRSQFGEASSGKLGLFMFSINLIFKIMFGKKQLFFFQCISARLTKTQQRNSKQYPSPRAKTKNPRQMDGSTNDDRSHSAATPSFSRVEESTFMQPHTASSNYIHSCSAEGPVLQQGDPAKPTVEGTFLPL